MAEAGSPLPDGEGLGWGSEAKPSVLPRVEPPTQPSPAGGGLSCVHANRSGIGAAILACLLCLLALLLPFPAAAQVMLSFQSFNGSMLGGRFPHTFVVLQGTLDATGAKVAENYGYSAKSVSPAILSGPVEAIVMTEPPKYITSTNRHFTVPISDATYWAIRAEVAKWRDAPGKQYRLDEHNCIHFVGAIAQLAGIKVDYPKPLIRKPKAWLNHIAALNPQLGAKAIG